MNHKLLILSVMPSQFRLLIRPMFVPMINIRWWLPVMENIKWEAMADQSQLDLDIFFILKWNMFLSNDVNPFGLGRQSTTLSFAPTTTQSQFAPVIRAVHLQSKKRARLDWLVWRHGPTFTVNSTDILKVRYSLEISPIVLNCVGWANVQWPEYNQWMRENANLN